MPAKKKNEKPLTLVDLNKSLTTHLAKFYNEMIDPRLQNIEDKLEEHDQRFNQIDQRFDDLYKKFEDLRQEYIIANHQMKRLEKTTVTKEEFQKEISDLKTKVTLLQEHIEELERRIPS